jgi:ubiquinol-cytochrome c reductase cytochrome b subunit
LHYLLSFLAAGLSILHIILLHEVGSTVVDSRQSGLEYVPFYPYYFYKDLFAFLLFLLFYLFIVFYMPNVFGHPDNYIPASIISTPAHIVPE